MYSIFFYQILFEIHDLIDHWNQLKELLIQYFENIYSKLFPSFYIKIIYLICYTKKLKSVLFLYYLFT